MHGAGSERRRLGFALVGLLALGACTVSRSCSCVALAPGGFDESQRHDSFVQTRVTKSGIGFLEANASTLVTAALPGGGTLSIPPSGCPDSPGVCCSGNAPPNCQVQLTVDSLNLTPEDPTTSPADAQARTLHFDVQVDAATAPGGSIPVTVNALIGDLTCNVTLNTHTSAGGSGPLDIAADLLFSVTPYDMTRIDFQNFQINNLQSNDYTIGGSGITGWGCDAVNFFKIFFNGFLAGALQGQAQQAAENALCETCASGTTLDCSAVPGVTCDSNHRCADSTRACIERLGLEGEVNAGQLLAQLSPSTQGLLDVYDVAGGYARTNTGGLSLGITGGAYAPAHSTCVPQVPPPTFTPDPPPASGYFTGTGGDVDPSGAPFDIGIGVSVDELIQASYAAFDGGVICVDLGTRTAPLLNSDTFALLVPSLGDLLHGETVPLLLSVRPQKPPTFKLGLGTFTTDPKTGMRSIRDPLVTVTIPQLAIDFYAFVDQRYVRVFTLTADIVMPMALDVSGSTLTPIIGDLKNAFQNAVVTNSYLLTENPTDIASKFPAVFSVAQGYLSTLLKGFDLPTLMGLGIGVNSITSVDSDGAGGYRTLAIFADLAAGPTKLGPAHTVATLDHVDVPSTEAFHVRTLADYDAGPVAVIDVSGTPPEGAEGQPLEYRYRVDQGFWSPFSQVAELRVQDPGFFIQGHHTIEVQARVVGHPESLDPETAPVDVLVDTVPPRVWLARAGWDADKALAPDPDGVVHRIQPPLPSGADQELLIVARDAVSPRGALAYSVSVSGGPFSDWSSDPRVRLPGPFAEQSLVVRVRDEAGNVAEVPFHGGIAPAAGGCSVSGLGGATGGRSATGLGLLVGMPLFFGLWGLAWRRRARWLRGTAKAGLAAGCLMALALNPGCECGARAPAAPDATPPVAPGSIGRYSSLGAGGGHVWVSAYEEQYGDLLVADVTRLPDPIPLSQWTIVDGVNPASPVVLNPAGYRGGVSDPGPDEGRWSSVAVDGGGNPYVAYEEYAADTSANPHDRGALRFAYSTDLGKTWKTMTVDPGTGTPGQIQTMYTSVALDASGTPAIAYFQSAQPDGAAGYLGVLKYARATTPTPQTQADWTVETIDQGPQSCGGLCASGTACLASNQQCVTLSPSACSPACAAGTGCYLGACVPIVPAPKAVDLPGGAGLFAQLAYLSTGDAVVAYYDHDNGALKVADRGAVSWATTDVMGGDHKQDVGQFCSLYVSPDDTLNLSFQSSIARALFFLRYRIGTAPNPPAVVDSGWRSGDRPHPVGDGSAIWPGADGRLRIVYQDDATANLMEAIQDAGGTWTTTGLPQGTGQAGYGFYASLKLDGARLVMSQYVYSRADAVLGQLHVTSLP